MGCTSRRLGYIETIMILGFFGGVMFHAIQQLVNSHKGNGLNMQAVSLSMVIRSSFRSMQLPMQETTQRSLLRSKGWR